MVVRTTRQRLSSIRVYHEASTCGPGATNVDSSRRRGAVIDEVVVRVAQRRIRDALGLVLRRQLKPDALTTFAFQRTQTSNPPISAVQKPLVSAGKRLPLPFGRPFAFSTTLRSS